MKIKAIIFLACSAVITLSFGLAGPSLSNAPASIDKTEKTIVKDASIGLLSEDKL